MAICFTKKNSNQYNEISKLVKIDENKDTRGIQGSKPKVLSHSAICMIFLEKSWAKHVTNIKKIVII